MIRQDNNLVFDWFDEKFKSFQNVVKPPEAFKKCNIPTNYSNVLTDLHSCTNPHKKSITQIDHGILPDSDDEDNMFRAHKYKISFTYEQSEILADFFKECTYLYNLCVDVWKKYNDVTDS